MQTKHHTPSTRRWLLTLSAIIVCATAAVAKTKTVRLPAGSTDGLATAIASAGPGGTVILESGVHRESATVTVDIPVAIIGEPDAVLEGSIVAGDTVVPVLHILGTEGVHIEGIAIQSALAPFGDVAILIQDAPRTTIQRNSIVDYNVGILIQYADHTVISENHMSNIARHGLININGRHVRIVGNEIIGSEIAEPFPFNGMWLCDVGGECLHNSVSGGWYNGILLCRLAGGPILPDGSEGIAETSATQWVVANNLSFNNDGGYVVANGAHDNVLANNAAYGNLSADIILGGEDEEESASYENLVTVGSHKDLVIWDFGIDNMVNGAAVVEP